MNLVLALAGLAGFGAGCLSFALLWWTVQAASRYRYPAALFAVSSILRCIAVAAVIVVAGRGQVAATVVALVGMLVARTLLIARFGQREQTGTTGED